MRSVITHSLRRRARCGELDGGADANPAMKLVTWIVLGVAIGTAIGASLGQLSTGVTLGAAFGVAVASFASKN
jgi:hypothetical protein